MLVRLGFAERRMGSGLGSWGKGLGVGFYLVCGCAWDGFYREGLGLKGCRFAEGFGFGREGLSAWGWGELGCGIWV